MIAERLKPRYTVRAVPVCLLQQLTINISLVSVAQSACANDADKERVTNLFSLSRPFPTFPELINARAY